MRGKLFKKVFTVRYQAERLVGSSIHELYYGVGIRVHADRPYRGRKQVARRHGVKSGRYHQSDSDIANLLPHSVLGTDAVRDHIGQWTVITDRASQDEGDVVRYRGVH